MQPTAPIAEAIAVAQRTHLRALDHVVRAWLAPKPRPKRLPAWAQESPRCPHTERCTGHGSYLGAWRSGGHQWAEYRCDACPALWAIRRFWA